MSLLTAQTGESTAAATVTNVDDPEQRGRIRVTCPALLGDESGELPVWIETGFTWGWFFVPDVGQQVTVHYSLGSENDVYAGQSSAMSPTIKWLGSISYTAEDAEDPFPVGDEFKVNYGKRRGFKTPSGHVLVFDDTARQEQIQLKWAGGNKANPKSAIFAFDKDGSAVLQSSDGATAVLNAKDSQISLIHPTGNRLLLTDDGIELVDKHGNAIILGAGGISIMSSNPVTIHGSDTIVRNGLHFADGLGLTHSVGQIAALLNSLTPQGATLKLNLPASIPGDGVALLAALDLAAQT